MVRRTECSGAQSCEVYLHNASLRLGTASTRSMASQRAAVQELLESTTARLEQIKVSIRVSRL